MMISVYVEHHKQELKPSTSSVFGEYNRNIPVNWSYHYQCLWLFNNTNSK